MSKYYPRSTSDFARDSFRKVLLSQDRMNYELEKLRDAVYDLVESNQQVLEQLTDTKMEIMGKDLYPEYSEDYPLGGTVEPYDIAIEAELTDE